MDWLDALLLDAVPALAVMSILALFIPTGKGLGVWRGIGLAWLAAFVVGLVIAFTNPDGWNLSCKLPILPGSYAPTSDPCHGSTSLDAWISALPALAGIAILVGWYLRNVRPWSRAAAVLGLLVGLTVVIFGVAQIDPNLGLLVLVIAVAALYAWPRLPRPAASSTPSRP